MGKKYQVKVLFLINCFSRGLCGHLCNHLTEEDLGKRCFN